METQNYQWRLLSLPFSEELSNAIQQQHHAAQLIAIAGKYLILQQPDDSNTNMQYLPDLEMLAGNKLSGSYRLTLHLSDLKLALINEENTIIADIGLSGKTKPEAYEAMKNLLSERKVDVSSLKNQLHYEIPKYALENGAVFSVNNKIFFQEAVNYRHNAELIMKNFESAYTGTFPVRIWPHHFDTGTMIVLAKDEKGNMTKTIGLGWAIPDSMMDEPYYYLSFWSANPEDNLSGVLPLSSGVWMTPEWNGAVLRQSEIMQLKSASDQNRLTRDFFKLGIEILVSRFKQ